MNRVLSREFIIEENISSGKAKIGIIGLSPSAGATFLTLCFSEFLSKTLKYKVTVAEVNDCAIYDAMALDKHFVDRNYFSFHEAVIKGASVRGKRNIDEGINWAARMPEDRKKDMDIIHKLRLINNLTGDLIICDFSGEHNAECFSPKYKSEALSLNKRLMEDMDYIIFVIDPMPSKILGNFERLKLIKSIEPTKPVIFVVNKYNDGVNLKEMNDFLKIKKPIFFPIVSSEVLYKAEYNCKSPFSQREVRNKIIESLNKLYQALKLGEN